MCGCSYDTVRKVHMKYLEQGEEIFSNSRKFVMFRKKPSKAPSEESLRAIYNKTAQELRKAAEDMARLRLSIEIGDLVWAWVESGSGLKKKIVKKRLEVDFIGRDYVSGKDDKGLRGTISIYDLWKNGEVVGQ